MQRVLGEAGRPATPEQAEELLHEIEVLNALRGENTSGFCSVVDGISVDIPEKVAEHLPPFGDDSTVIGSTLRASLEFGAIPRERGQPLRADLGGTAVAGTITFAREEQFVTGLSGKIKVKYPIIHSLTEDGGSFELERIVTTDEAPSEDIKSGEEVLVAVFSSFVHDKENQETETALGINVVGYEEADQIIELLSSLRAT